MNKLIIIALAALCIANVHGMVKRDVAAPTTENYFEQIKDTMNGIGEQFKKAFKPEEFQKKFDEAVETLKKSLDDIKSNIDHTTPKAAA